MNILKALRKPYLSVIIASIFLFVSCDNSESLPDVDSKIQKEYKTTSIKNAKLSNNLNSSFNSKYAKKGANDFDFDNINEVENVETGEISYMIDSNVDEKIKLGVYPIENGEFNFLIVEYGENGNNKEIVYKKTNGEILVTISANTITEEVSITYPNKTNNYAAKGESCGQKTSDCLVDSYSNRGWTSVGLWIVTAFYPAFAIGAAAGCAAAVC
ncbi:hypothetical protein [Polaribacter sp. Asnod6-C07]|uniref:hypothetical protein n=1 Tax=Polaribacter sp. Asnod6-C07 TaxID=3160582 RepID=UPI0038677241